MPRSEDDNQLPPYAKYAVFKRAFDTIEFFIENGNIIGGFILSFSILEDRLRAAMVDCFNAIEEPLRTTNISRMQYHQVVGHLKRIDVIDPFLARQLLEAAYLRNRVTHGMMWNLDVFKIEDVQQYKKLINEVKRCHRKYLRERK